MKSYKQMAADVLARRDVYLKKQKATRRALAAISLSFCCVCLTVFAGFGWFGGGIKREQELSVQDSTVIGEDDTIDPDELIDEDADDMGALQDSVKQSATEDRIKALEEQSRKGDLIGWLLYQGKVYVQVQNEDISSAKAETYLGRAFDFRGVYQIQREIDGAVYTVSDAPNRLLIELENGGTVLLKAEAETE